MTAFLVYNTDFRNMEDEALDERGRLRVLPAAWWQRFKQTEIAHFCVEQGLYCIPTTELVEHLAALLPAGPDVIEIGAGNGVLSEALGIVATDSMMQLQPEIMAYYNALGQPIVNYGANVKRMDAATAIRKLKPKTVLACWVTHKFRPAEEWREGNAFGVAEEQILDRGVRYVFVGNERVHKGKPIWDRPHSIHFYPWLVSRRMTAARDFIAVWEPRS